MDFKGFDDEKISLHNVESDKENNLYRSKLTYDNETLQIKIPRMILRTINKENKAISLEFTEDNEEFYQFIRTFENMIKDRIVLESGDIIGKTIPSKSVETMYKSFVHLPTNLSKLPTIQVQFDADNLSVLNKGDDEMAFENVQENSEVESLLSIENVIFYRNKCLLEINLNTVKILSQVSQISTYMFTDDTDEDASEKMDSEC